MVRRPIGFPNLSGLLPPNFLNLVAIAAGAIDIDLSSRSAFDGKSIRPYSNQNSLLM